MKKLIYSAEVFTVKIFRKKSISKSQWKELSDPWSLMKNSLREHGNHSISCICIWNMVKVCIVAVWGAAFSRRFKINEWTWMDSKKLWSILQKRNTNLELKNERSLSAKMSLKKCTSIYCGFQIDFSNSFNSYLLTEK